MPKIKLSREELLSGKIDLPKNLKFALAFKFQFIHCELPPTHLTTTFEVSPEVIKLFLNSENLYRHSKKTIENYKKQIETQRKKILELKEYIELHKKSEKELLFKVIQLEKNIQKIEENQRNPIDERLVPKSPISHTALLAEKGVDLRTRALSAGLPSLGKKR